MVDTATFRLNRTPVRWAVMGLGFSSAVTQLVLLRELLSAFQGNELILGVVLGNWLLLTGLGAGLGPWVVGAAAKPALAEAEGQVPRGPGSRRDGEPNRASRNLALRLAALQFWIALIPFAQVLAVRLGRDAVFVRGVALGLDETAWSSLCVLAPYALASGLFLTLASRMADDTDAARGATSVYLADCVGSVAGGALFTFALVRWLDHLALLVVPAVGNLLLAALTLRRFAGGRSATVPLGLAAGVAALVAWTNPDALTTAWQCRPDRVVFRAQSPYGRLVVTASGGQLNFLENGLPLLSSHQIERAEEIVHVALAQRPSARDVLLLSGALSGTVGEVLKYGVTNVTCVELDPAILEAGRRLLPERLADARARVVTTDGRRFVQRTASRYDVVIVDMPAPATAQLNRYYTAEFFAEVKRALKPEGVVVFGLGQYDNYVSPELERVLASAGRTLRRSFRNGLLLPASRVWFVGSDGPLTSDIAARLEQARVPTQWMRRSYLDALLTPERLAAVQSAAAAVAPLNTDFRPALYFLHLRHWLSQFDVWLGTVAGLLGVGVVVYGLRLSAPGFAVFGAGLAGSSLEVVLLLGVQVLYGSLYQQLGLVVTVFMAGLAAGAWLGGASRKAPARNQPGSPAGPPGTRSAEMTGPRGNRLHLAGVALALAAYGLGLPWVLHGLSRAGAAGWPSWVGPGAIAVLTAALGVLVGLEFPLACRVEGGDARSLAARLFTADFVGAWVGAVLAGAVLIPVLGVAMACGLAAGLNLVAGLLLLGRRRGGTVPGNGPVPC